MHGLLDAPRGMLATSVVLLWLSAYLGAYAAKTWRPPEGKDREDFTVVLTATFTLLGLIIGFSFSMAISRFDQRKNDEEAEANAIGTEYSRTGLLPAASAERAKGLLRQYLDQRILFYRERDDDHLAQISDRTARLEREMWSVVESVAAVQPTPVVALATAGMNDVLNTRADTVAAWRNRIPEAAWLLMAVIALCCCVLTGYTAHHARPLLFAILAMVLSVAFFLIADIESPRHGLVRVVPENLMSVATSMQEGPR